MREKSTASSLDCSCFYATVKTTTITKLKSFLYVCNLLLMFKINQLFIKYISVKKLKRELKLYNKVILLKYNLNLYMQFFTTVH